MTKPRLRLVAPPTKIEQSEKLEKVLEKLATTERTMIVIERHPEGKMRVRSES